VCREEVSPRPMRIDMCSSVCVTCVCVRACACATGAFMATNLLAHSRLFQAGIGRSGAYNRLLTPFGFQSEERTLWEAPEVYMKMSPFANADKIDAPLLLLHGAEDNNPGTTRVFVRTV